MKKPIFRFLTLIIVLFLTHTIAFSQTAVGLSLGKLSLVPPHTAMSQSDRVIKMNMSKSVISNDVINKVGGIAFVETAKPSFEVESFFLDCDFPTQKAFAMIDGKRYDIPLDVWQLQPIVEYANDSNNVVVTLYGEGENPILFHPAFLDKLLGLRLLQMDILLTGTSRSLDSIVIDKYSEGIADYSFLQFTLELMKQVSEWMQNYQINEDDLCKLPAYYGTDYLLGKNEKKICDIYDGMICRKGKESMERIVNYLIESGELYTSYIYTDFGQNIVFDTNNNQLLISGGPYYRFTRPDVEIDTVETYINIQENISSWWKEELEENGVEKSERLYPRIAKIKNISGRNIPTKQKAQAVFSIIDSCRIIDESKPINENDLSERLMLDAWYIMSLKTKQQVIVLEDLTNYLKENVALVNHLNPIVVSSSQATCQWAAFFRYAKENNPRNWKKFISQVSKLNYDAPDVYTPVDIR